MCLSGIPATWGVGIFGRVEGSVLKSVLLTRRRRSVVVALTAAAAVATLAFRGIDTGGTDIETASSSVSVPSVVLTQMDGTPPFDPVDSSNGDSSSSNGLVRSGDNVAFIVDIDPGPTGLSGASVTLPLWKGLRLDTVPAFCGPGSGLVPAGVLSVLTCSVGDLAPHQRTTRAVTVTASAAAAAPEAALSTSATLTATSPITLVTSNTTRLTFLPRPEGCEPKEVSMGWDPAIRPIPNPIDASGQVADIVLDENGAAVPGADVTLTGQDLCGDLIERRITASESGRFAFVGLVAGLYHVTATAPDESGIPRRSPTVTVALSERNMTASALDLRMTAADSDVDNGSW